MSGYKTLSSTFYLALSEGRYGALKARITQKLPALHSGEVALALNLQLPQALFAKPSLRATVTVPESAISQPVIDSIVMDNIKEVMQQQLGVNLEISVVEHAPAPGS